MEKMDEKILEKVVKKMRGTGSLKEFFGMSEEARKTLALDTLAEVISDEAKRANYSDVLPSLKNDFGFNEILGTPGFSIMYCEENKSLCSVEKDGSDVCITLVSPYLGVQSYNNFGDFVPTMSYLQGLEGDLPTYPINPSDLPLLSFKEKRELAGQSFEEYFNLTPEQIDRYHCVGAVEGVAFREAEMMEAEYGEMMRNRQLRKDALLQERMSCLPDTFKEYISQPKSTAVEYRKI